MILQGNAVLILPDELPEKTKGGIAVPKTVKEKPITGKVMDHGPTCQDVYKGARVHFGRKAASIITIDNVDYCFTTEDKMLYIE